VQAAMAKSKDPRVKSKKKSYLENF
jgi:hypothetical protein